MLLQSFMRTWSGRTPGGSLPCPLFAGTVRFFQALERGKSKDHAILPGFGDGAGAGGGKEMKGKN
jgi:hypothetical protein